MGVKVERQRLLHFKSFRESLELIEDKNNFKMIGKLEEWKNTEYASRIFYKKLEGLLYGNKLIYDMYEKAIKKILDERNLTDMTIFDMLKTYQFKNEKVDLLIMEIFDFVYFNVKKKLPYLTFLSNTSGAVSELFENIYKYSGREFCLTTVLSDSEFPLKITFENNYELMDEGVKQNLKKLQEGIDEINRYEDPKQAYIEVMKNRMIEAVKEDSTGSRLGYAKIRAETNGKISLDLNSEFFGESGITIVLKIPLTITPKENITKTIEDIL